MATELTNQAERERLESLTRTYTSAPLSLAILGLMYAAFGAAWLFGHPAFVRRGHAELLYPLIFLGIYVIPRALRRYYYEPKFGYAKPVTPYISDGEFWLAVLGATIFFVILVPFVILPGMQSARDTWRLEPMSFFTGIGFCAAGAFQILKRSRNTLSWRLFPLGLLLIAFSLMPALHLQTKEQVSNGWIWTGLGFELIFFGLRDHLVLLRSLSAAPSDHLNG